ncbi:hypothetical protein C2S51_028106 [Perilla frutescens var. frutescens]|nr:hypothetical protein C2S51_028106 [Perilla frutescens var. frutescens]
MASEEAAFIESLINSRNRDISLFLPFILGLNAATPLQNPATPPDRIVLINPFTQGMVVIERSTRDGDGDGDSSSLGFDSLLNDLLSSKIGRPPASKASIAAMESVEVDEDDDRCVICLEEWEAGERAKRMPCKHRFHGECIEKWLNIHGTCPVCRYEMPADETDDNESKARSGGERRRREIWVTFTFGSERRSDHGVSSERRSDSIS